MIHLTSRANPLLRHIRTLQSDAVARAAEGSCVGDGGKLLREAHQAGLAIRRIFVTADWYNAHTDFVTGINAAEHYLLPDDLLGWLSAQPSPEGVVFEAKLPPRWRPGSAGRLLLLDGIADPGNLGTLLRTANAFAFDGAVLVNGCTDMFSPKSLRAAMGSTFRLACAYMDVLDAVVTLRGLNIPLIGTALSNDAVDLSRAQLPPHAAIAIGSESHGLSEYIQKSCDITIKIPMPGHAESLNAAIAGGIMMYSMSIAGHK